MGLILFFNAGRRTPGPTIQMPIYANWVGGRAPRRCRRPGVIRVAHEVVGTEGV